MYVQFGKWRGALVWVGEKEATGQLHQEVVLTVLLQHLTGENKQTNT